MFRTQARQIALLSFANEREVDWVAPYHEYAVAAGYLTINQRGEVMKTYTNEEIQEMLANGAAHYIEPEVASCLLGSAGQIGRGLLDPFCHWCDEPLEEGDFCGAECKFALSELQSAVQGEIDKMPPKAREKATKSFSIGRTKDRCIEVLAGILGQNIH